VRAGPNLHTAAADTLLPCGREAAFAAVEALAALLWGDRVEVVTEQAPARLLQRVSAGGDIEAWVTWELTAAGSGAATRVRLVVDEADTSPGPEPELDEVLALLLERVAAGAVG
jgi:hypothetical protein